MMMDMTEKSGIESRLGLNVPDGWWPTTPVLKEIEASGFDWVQLPSPPREVILDPRQNIRHASALGELLGTTALNRVLHAPDHPGAEHPDAQRLLEGALSYAAESGCRQLIFHGFAVMDEAGARERLLAELELLKRAAPTAESLGIVIAVENTAPVYPGPQDLSAVPMSLRGLVRRVGSESVRLCLDLGHANVIAGLRRTSVADLVEPVLDVTSIFHVHDNLGGRFDRSQDRPEIDPLKLDLHLPPGRGSLPWADVQFVLRRHSAPLMLEVNPPHRPSPAELATSIAEVLGVGAGANANTGRPVEA